MFTVVPAGVASLTRASGTVPKPSSTLSPLSADWSSVAAEVKDFDVSPVWNVTLASTPG